MKTPMSRMTIYGSKKNRKAVLEFLQRQNIIDISEAEDDNEQFGFTVMSTGESQSEFMRCRSEAEHALEILDGYVPEEASVLSALNGRETLSVEEYYRYADAASNRSEISKRIIEIYEEISAKKARIVRLENMLDELQPWMQLDAAIDSPGTRKTKCLVGVFGAELSAERIYELYRGEGDMPPVYVEVISAQPQQTCVFVIFEKLHASECEGGLRRIGFAAPKTAHYGIPRDTAVRHRKEISELRAEINLHEADIKSYKGMRREIRFLIDYYAIRTEKYRVLSRLSQNGHVFVITGFVPSGEVNRLTAVLAHEYDAAAENESAGADAPVLLKNGCFSEPVEGVVRTFAMPGRGDIDPTAFMSVFYYVFFGLMLSDAGYGLLITIGCAAAIRQFPDMERSMKGTLRMFLYCGISTMFWGLMFGSFFGDAVEVISSTFFDKTFALKPLWFEPVDDPMRMLMWSFLFGLIHLFTGLAIKIYQCVRAGDYMSALVEGVFIYMLVGGGVVYLFRVDMFLNMAGIDTRLPAVYADIAAISAIAGAVGILLLSGRGGGIGRRLAKGAYSLYGITGWLSDLLSYSRLLALGLATGVIATVFNKMGSMFGGGFIGAVIFTIVFTIGHALNIGVNLLGAYVHTNRLQFVEFFGKFYEGGGREFKPFSIDTKYYRIKKE